MKKMHLTAALLLLAGCFEKPAEKLERSSNDKLPVETLFRYDGCTVYRFDDGDKHYFVKRQAADGETISTQMPLRRIPEAGDRMGRYR